MNNIDSGRIAKSLERIADALEKLSFMYSNPPLIAKGFEKFEYPEPFGQKIKFEPYRSGPLQAEYLNIEEVKEKD